MGLCGSFRCGCAVNALTSSLADPLNGTLPNIAVLGSGEVGDPRRATLDVPWANEVAALRDTIDSTPSIGGAWIDIPLYPAPTNRLVMYQSGGSFDANLSGFARYRQLAGSSTYVMWKFSVTSAPTVPIYGVAVGVLFPPTLPLPGGGTFATYVIGAGQYKTGGGTVYQGGWSINLEPSGSGFGFPFMSFQVFGGYGTSFLGANPYTTIGIGDVASGWMIYQDDRQTSAPA